MRWGSGRLPPFAWISGLRGHPAREDDEEQHHDEDQDDELVRAHACLAFPAAVIAFAACSIARPISLYTAPGTVPTPWFAT